MNDLNKKTSNAIKWSAITELIARFIPPLTNMLLARILAPEAFGVIATVTMVITFAEVFVESGFQKFLIQHEFDSSEQEQQYVNVAFWSNLAFSCFIWLIISVFCQPIARLAGNEELDYLIAITGSTIPLYGIIGILDCRLKKSLEFNKLFYIRTSSAFVPLLITLPLALMGLDFWALIIGNIAGVILRTLILLFIDKYKPSPYFSFPKLKHMLKYGIWTLLDGIAVWATAWIDTLMISHYMSDYYLGLYKNSTSTITILFSLVTATFAPVLFSSLSKLQNEPDEFNNLFLSVYKKICVFLLPLGIGLYGYRELATLVMFGDGWIEAANIIGVMAITTTLRTIFVSLYSDLYRAKGKFHIPLIMQVCDLVLLVAVCVISVQYGFWSLVYARAFIKLDLAIPSLIVAWFVCKLSPLKTFKSIWHILVATSAMTVAMVLLQSVSKTVIWSFVSIIICILVYFGILFAFRKEREELFWPIVRKFIKTKK